MEEYYNKKIKENKNTQILKKICINIIYAFLIVLMLVEIIMLIFQLKGDGKNTAIFGYKAFCIISGSMEPNIKVNDIIIVKEPETNEIHKGEIISFTINGETITHRVENIQEDVNGKIYYTTKGDANNTEDVEKVKFEDIEGIYVCRIPVVGKIVIVLQKKTTLIIVIILLLVVYGFEQKTDMKKRKRKREREEYEEEKRSGI